MQKASSSEAVASAPERMSAHHTFLCFTTCLTTNHRHVIKPYLLNCYYFYSCSFLNRTMLHALIAYTVSLCILQTTGIKLHLETL